MIQFKVNMYSHFRGARKILNNVLKAEHLVVSGLLNGVEIDDFWYAVIKYSHLRKNPLISAVHTKQSKTGILWVPDTVAEPALYTSSSPVEIPSGQAVVLDLPDWDDPVIPTLHDMDMAPRGVPTRIVEGGIYSYAFHFETSLFSGEILTESRIDNPKLDKLSGALRTTLYFFVDIAQADFLNALFEDDAGYEWYKRVKQWKAQNPDQTER